MDLAAGEQRVVDQVRNQLYIGGEWQAAAGGARFPVEDPSTGEVLCQVADASPEDGVAALDVAVAAQAEWAAHPAG